MADALNSEALKAALGKVFDERIAVTLKGNMGPEAGGDQNLVNDFVNTARDKFETYAAKAIIEKGGSIDEKTLTTTVLDSMMKDKELDGKLLAYAKTTTEGKNYVTPNGTFDSQIQQTAIDRATPSSNKALSDTFGNSEVKKTLTEAEHSTTAPATAANPDALKNAVGELFDHKIAGAIRDNINHMGGNKALADDLMNATRDKFRAYAADAIKAGGKLDGDALAASVMTQMAGDEDLGHKLGAFNQSTQWFPTGAFNQSTQWFPTDDAKTLRIEGFTKVINPAGNAMRDAFKNSVEDLAKAKADSTPTVAGTPPAPGATDAATVAVGEKPKEHPASQPDIMQMIMQVLTSIFPMLSSFLSPAGAAAPDAPAPTTPPPAPGAAAPTATGKESPIPSAPSTGKLDGDELTALGKLKEDLLKKGLSADEINTISALTSNLSKDGKTAMADGIVKTEGIQPGKDALAASGKFTKALEDYGTKIGLSEKAVAELKKDASYLGAGDLEKAASLINDAGKKMDGPAKTQAVEPATFDKGVPVDQLKSDQLYALADYRKTLEAKGGKPEDIEKSINNASHYQADEIKGFAKGATPAAPAPTTQAPAPVADKPAAPTTPVPAAPTPPASPPPVADKPSPAIPSAVGTALDVAAAGIAGLAPAVAAMGTAAAKAAVDLATGAGKAADTKAPEAGKDTKAPETSKDTKAPEAGKDTKAPETGKDTKAPETGKDTKAPETGKDTKAPETGKDTKAPETGKDTKAPETGKDTKAPETGKDTKAPETGKDTKAPETGKDTKAPETGKDTKAPTPAVADEKRAEALTAYTTALAERNEALTGKQMSAEEVTDLAKKVANDKTDTSPEELGKEAGALNKQTSAIKEYMDVNARANGAYGGDKDESDKSARYNLTTAADNKIFNDADVKSIEGSTDKIKANTREREADLQKTNAASGEAIGRLTTAVTDRYKLDKGITDLTEEDKTRIKSETTEIQKKLTKGESTVAGTMALNEEAKNISNETTAAREGNKQLAEAQKARDDVADKLARDRTGLPLDGAIPANQQGSYDAEHSKITAQINKEALAGEMNSTDSAKVMRDETAPLKDQVAKLEALRASTEAVAKAEGRAPEDAAKAGIDAVKANSDKNPADLAAAIKINEDRTQAIADNEKAHETHQKLNGWSDKPDDYTKPELTTEVIKDNTAVTTKDNIENATDKLKTAVSNYADTLIAGKTEDGKSLLDPVKKEEFIRRAMENLTKDIKEDPNALADKAKGVEQKNETAKADIERMQKDIAAEQKVGEGLDLAKKTTDKDATSAVEAGKEKLISSGNKELDKILAGAQSLIGNMKLAAVGVNPARIGTFAPSTASNGAGQTNEAGKG